MQYNCTEGNRANHKRRLIKDHSGSKSELKLDIERIS